MSVRGSPPARATRLRRLSRERVPSLDWRVRGAALICRPPDAVLAEALAKASALLQRQLPRCVYRNPADLASLAAERQG